MYIFMLLHINFFKSYESDSIYIWASIYKTVFVQARSTFVFAKSDLVQKAKGCIEHNNEPLSYPNISASSSLSA